MGTDRTQEIPISIETIERKKIHKEEFSKA